MRTLNLLKRKRQSIWPAIICLLLLLGQPAFAALPPEDGEIYTFQADDALRTLSVKYYDDALAYPAIIEATNRRAESDARFLTILSVETIQVGQRLFIPDQSLIGIRSTQNSPVDNPEPSPEQLELLSRLTVVGRPPELQNQIWLNSAPLKLDDLRGQVVIIEFWTYG